MSKKRKRIMRWKCSKCKRIITQDGKPDQCKFCKQYGTYEFYGAKVVKK